MRRTLVTIVFIFAAAASLPTAIADEPADTATPEAVRNDAISKLVAWKTEPAEVDLKNAEDLDKTQPYLTARGLLMVTNSLNQDDKMVQKGVDILEAQAKRDPTDPVAEYYLGVALNWLEKRGQAKAAWSRARDRAEAQIEKDPRDPRAHFYRGAALVQLQDSAEAIKELKKAERFGFDPTMVNFQLGLAYLLEEKWGLAKEAFDEVHSVDQRYAHLYFYRGLAWDKLDRKDQMLKDFDQFVRLAPNAPEAKTARAILSAMK